MSRAARSRPSTPLVVAVLSICGTVVSLQQTLVIPMLPMFPELLNTSADTASWLVTITLLVGAVATPIVARLADMFGKRLMMLLCLGTVIVGSLLPALGPETIGVVIAGRGLQGVGAALIPVGISIMRDELPPNRVGSAVALMSATLGIGGAIGMPLSGVLSDRFSYHALFWVSAVFAAVMFAAVLVVIPQSQMRTGGRFDYVGAVLLSVALVGLLLGISKGGTWGWGSEQTLVSFVVAAVFLALWLPSQLRVGQPLVDLRTSVRRPVLLTNIASLLLGFAMFGNMLSTTQQMQMPEATGYGFGLSVTQAGLAMLPGGLAMVVFAPISASVTRRFGAKFTLIVGSLLMAAGYLLRVFLTHSVAQVLIGATVISIGTAIGYAAMPILIMRSVPITETASANGLNTLLRAIGTSTSSAAVVAFLGASTMVVSGQTLPTLEAFKHTFWVAMVAALIAVGVALAIPGLPASAPAATPAPTASPSDEDDAEELIVSGVVHTPTKEPLNRAVASALRMDGEQIDWGRTDDTGTYRLALRHGESVLLVLTADGFAPRSEIVRVTDAELPPTELRERLTMRGTVTDCGQAAPGAGVALVRHLGEQVAHTVTDEHGGYELPLPTSGRYVLSAWRESDGAVLTRSLAVLQESTRVDLDLADR
ncbi:MFS transporter [Demetria terragena]|uniref:MFS transporter n=1 Tax=Demetria terragena TaxID=63959 RepID=UPI0003711583|nr:MFS transporter [Demetria terragena]